MRRHPEYTARILGQVEQLGDLAAIAAAHHERLDGQGYHLGLTASQLGPSARVLAVADVAEALSADRPYRVGLAPDVVLDIIGKDAGTALDADASTALREAWTPAPLVLQTAA
jgi:HD-GYP domain-containing protein (c-di-GMP phosphodiesterase class II)